VLAKKPNKKKLLFFIECKIINMIKIANPSGLKEIID
jgi:hypothetical protein